MWRRNGKQKTSLRDDENFTFLGKGVDFKGVVNFDGTVRIDGRLEGEIHTKGTLVIGEHAQIKGVISAGSLVCSGKINGNISATEKVELMKTAVLIGDVRAPSFSMESGAHFHGMCDMGATKCFTDDHQDIDKVHDLAAHRGKVRIQDLPS
ncbi:MAG: polymer-forming cytoskeletal protein [Nitrospiraceae bacterium]